MRRILFVGVFAAGAALNSGCSMCCAPLDYCGPVVESENNCDFTYRHNSVLYGDYGPYIEEAPAEAIVQSQPQLQPIPDRHYSPHGAPHISGRPSNQRSR